jgi:hypothetical protein
MAELLEAIKSINDAPADENLRITRRIEIGHAVQQGDLYVHRVTDDHVRGQPIGADRVQVALGTGNGARHCAEGPVKVYQGATLPDHVRPPMDVDGVEITGPVIVADGAWLLTHPEHPHHRLPPGTYQVTYQFDVHTMQRVVD